MAFRTYNSELQALQNFVVKRVKYAISQRIPDYLQDETQEKELYIQADFASRNIVVQLEHFVHTTTESTRFDRHEIKSVEESIEGWIPARIRDHLLLKLGLNRWARMIPLKRIITLHTLNQHVVTERHCPHIRADRNSQQHTMFLVPPELYANGSEHKVHRRS